MRDPKRIRPFLDRLATTWERVPDLRFGQLVIGVGTSAGFVDPWSPEEPEWIGAMRGFDEKVQGEKVQEGK